MKQVVVFCDPEFPKIGTLPHIENVDIQGLSIKVVDAETLDRALTDERIDCLVTLHGPYFPKLAWRKVRSYLESGGGLLTFGGAPFRHPVLLSENGYEVEPCQTAYLHSLRIVEAIPVSTRSAVALRHNRDIPALENLESLFEIQDTWGLTLHATSTSDDATQLGSSGTMDLRIAPLLTASSEDGREIAAPVVLLENLRGDFSGGRWVFVNQAVTSTFWESGGVDALLSLAEFCANGVTDIDIRPNLAVYETGECPTVLVRAQHLVGASVSGTLEVRVTKNGDDCNELLWCQLVEMTIGSELETWRLPLSIDVQPGLYEIVARWRTESGELHIFRQGYWGMDRTLLAEGSRLVHDRDYFYRDGRPLPVVGMTYMASDVARKFLFLPNVALWDRDMRQMKEAGINLIRTGIWNAWRHIMLEDGYASEEVLRSIDAFLLTAKRHGLEVTFTFFAFTPEVWGGKHPYLDRRAVEAQKRFVRSIVTRHRNSSYVHWDLINEPSVGDPKRVFSGPRATHDDIERAAWHKWLQARHGTIETLQRRWNETPENLPDFYAAALPEPTDINFDVTDMAAGKRGQKWLDFCLFTMDVFNDWARKLNAVIKDACSEGLVTVGQDEALAGQRPSPFFYAETVDYTTVHSWWQNDHLVWDGLFSKVPDKPCLVQETGIMYLERANGHAKRSEEELEKLLERKYAYAFATACAGAVQWIWNTNSYMDNINESNIGALRADGTQKPETEVSYAFGRFMASVRDLFRHRQLEDVVVVYPYSNDFSNRPLAFRSTTALTRVLNYDLKVPFRGVSEYHLDSLDVERPKCVVVPSPHNLSDHARAHLLALAHDKGVTIVWTGPLGLDPYWQLSSVVSSLLPMTGLRGLKREECLIIGDKRYPASFDGHTMSAADAGTDGAHETGTVSIRTLPYGAGKIIWCPLPLELNSNRDTLAVFHRYALAQSGVEQEMEWLRGDNLVGIYGRRLAFVAGSLYVFVSECGYDAPIMVRDRETNCTYEFTLPSERAMLFVTNKDGELISSYRSHEVKVKGTDVKMPIGSGQR